MDAPTGGLICCNHEQERPEPYKVVKLTQKYDRGGERAKQNAMVLLVVPYKHKAVK